MLARHCHEIGRDFGEIGRTLHGEFVVGRDDADLAAKLERAGAQRGISADEYRERTFTYVGSPAQVVEQLAPVRDAGSVYTICYFPDAAWGDSAELFAAEVIPALR